jgi:WD40 repeat protein
LALVTSDPMNASWKMSHVLIRGRDLRRALLFSLGAVVLLVVGEGLLVLPTIERQEPRIAVRHCVFRNHGDLALTLFRVCPPFPTSTLQFVLGWHDLSTARPEVRIAFAGIDPVTAIDVATEQLIVIAGGKDIGSIYTLNLLQSPATARWLGRQADGEAMAVAISPDRRWLLSHGLEAVYLWDLEQRELKWRRAAEARCLAFAPQVDRILCGLMDGRVVEMSLFNGEIGATIAVHRSPVTCLAVGPQGRRLASAGEYERIVVSDLHDHKTCWSASHTSTHTMHFSPDGKVLLTSRVPEPCTWRKPILDLRDAQTGELMGRLTSEGEGIQGAAFVNDSLVYTWGLDGAIHAWDIRQRLPLKVVTPALPARLQ